MGGSGLDWIDGFQKFCGSGLDRIQLLRIRIGVGLNNFTVCSSLKLWCQAKFLTSTKFLICCFMSVILLLRIKK